MNYAKTFLFSHQQISHSCDVRKAGAGLQNARLFQRRHIPIYPLALNRWRHCSECSKLWGAIRDPGICRIRNILLGLADSQKTVQRPREILHCASRIRVLGTAVWKLEAVLQSLRYHSVRTACCANSCVRQWPVTDRSAWRYVSRVSKLFLLLELTRLRDTRQQKININFLSKQSNSGTSTSADPWS